MRITKGLIERRTRYKGKEHKQREWRRVQYFQERSLKNPCSCWACFVKDNERDGVIYHIQGEEE
jgi:hypothetical protein